jgi:hypothetical protein
VSGQLESNHYYRPGDRVRQLNGELGIVIEGWTLYAVVVWDDGRSEEGDQFDPRLSVIERGREE